jgi:hypothetical protein
VSVEIDSVAHIRLLGTSRFTMTTRERLRARTTGGCGRGTSGDPSAERGRRVAVTSAGRDLPRAIPVQSSRLPFPRLRQRSHERRTQQGGISEDAPRTEF